MMQKQLLEFVLLLFLTDGTLYLTTITCVTERKLFTFDSMSPKTHDNNDLWTVNSSISQVQMRIRNWMDSLSALRVF